MFYLSISLKSNKNYFQVLSNKQETTLMYSFLFTRIILTELMTSIYIILPLLNYLVIHSI